MTKLLERAFEEASLLTPEDQDAFAIWLLDELQADQRWQHSLARSDDTLAALADEALEEHLAGKTRPLTHGH